MAQASSGNWAERMITIASSQFRVDAYGLVYAKSRPMSFMSSGRWPSSLRSTLAESIVAPTGLSFAGVAGGMVSRPPCGSCSAVVG